MLIERIKQASPTSTRSNEATSIVETTNSQQPSTSREANAVDVNFTEDFFPEDIFSDGMGLLETGVITFFYNGHSQGIAKCNEDCRLVVTGFFHVMRDFFT